MSQANLLIAAIVMWSFVIIGALSGTAFGITGVGLAIGITYLMITLGCDRK